VPAAILACVLAGVALPCFGSGRSSAARVLAGGRWHVIPIQRNALLYRVLSLPVSPLVPPDLC
jgi:hypothetical protein